MNGHCTFVNTNEDDASLDESVSTTGLSIEEYLKTHVIPQKAIRLDQPHVQMILQKS